MISPDKNLKDTNDYKMLHDLVTTIKKIPLLFVKDTKMLIIHTLNIYLRNFFLRQKINKL